mgnify:FL=1
MASWDSSRVESPDRLYLINKAVVLFLSVGGILVFVILGMYKPCHCCIRFSL